MNEIKFKRDTAFRKQFFVLDSFAHPAKMDASLLIWIVEHYSEVGETILDPMAGSGTTLLACTLGRNVVLVELEEKFCKMCRDNWEIVKMHPQLGYSMGTCQIIQGDSRQLENILCDKIITSPPFAGNTGGLRSAKSFKYGNDPVGKRMMGGIKGGTGESPDNIDHLPYGNIDGIITSPPYEGSDVSQTHMTSDKRGDKDNPNYRPSWKRKLREGYARTKRPYHEVDSIITSPPYEDQIHKGTGQWSKKEDGYMTGVNIGKDYTADEGNVGNLKSESYLEAMLQVYRSCFAVLRDGGLMILIIKPFIRDQKLVPLQEDTRQLCQQTGFVFVEEHHRILPSQSFWRVIYAKRFPNAPKIDREYILVFKK